MLTTKQPTSYGYKSVHDLPTPPPTSRPSPPLAYQQEAYHHTPSAHHPRQGTIRPLSPTSQPMSAPHRGLPPPAAMALPPQQSHPPPGAPPHHSQQPPPPMSSSHHQQSHSGSWSSLPAPPQHWHGSEEPMKHWLQARAEEEKTRQEEERTRQETLRLEQRKVEMDMLRASLGGGIPPPMIPLVFAGMGTGIMPQAAFEWAQQFMQSTHATPALAGIPQSSEHHREHSGSESYPGAASASQGPGRYGSYPGSPARSRAQAIAGPGGRPTAPAGLNTGVPQPGPLIMSAGHAHSHSHASQQETSPSIYFHHWQPPTSQSQLGSSHRPGSPSAETPRKRKATGQPEPAPSQPRLRTPPPIHTSSTNPSPSKRGHRRQRSDMPWTTRSRPAYNENESRAASREASPGYSHDPPRPRDTDSAEAKKHSVSSMLTGESREAQHRQGSPSR